MTFNVDMCYTVILDILHEIVDAYTTFFFVSDTTFYFEQI